MPRVRGPGELEAALMDRMWAAGQPTTVREIRAALTPERELRREMVSRAWVYSPVATLEQYSARVIESVLSASTSTAQ